VKTGVTRKPFPELRWLKLAYLFLLYLMGLTGFAQMPIFKRYYIADLPGLGWLAQFYTTHTLHYIGAILLLALVVYAGTVYVSVLRKRYHLTWSTDVRIVLLAAIVITGIFRVLKNLPDVVFSPGFTMFIDISHLGFMMVFMCFGIVTLATRQPWLREGS